MQVSGERVVTILVAFIVLSPFFMTFLANAQDDSSFPLKTGPYVDKIVYNVIEGDDQAVIALQENEIDLIGDLIDPSFLGTLVDADYIEVANTLRNGYGFFSINTEKYPFNITAFRRAFAFALDKERISDEVWDGLSVPQDSCVPQFNPFSIEDQLSYSYYTSNVTFGKQLLDQASFLDIDDDGFREAPNGSDFDVEVFISYSSNIALEVGGIAVEALLALGIDAYLAWDEWYPFDYWYSDFDIVFIGTNFDDFDVEWLAYEYWSEYANETYRNHPRWRNTSYDSWRSQLLNSSTYEEVYEAAIEMQRIFVYECPIVVAYENMLLSAYRTDRFEGFVNDVSDCVPSWWTNYKVHLRPNQGGPYGGTLRWSNSLDIDTFNFMASTSAYANNVLQMTHDSLIKSGPDGVDIMWLAESYVIETHDDNPSIPDNTTQLTFQMIENATWSDGMPLTSVDVAFTLLYYRDSPGNPYGDDLDGLITAISPTPYTLRLELECESYWHLHRIGYKPILPRHIFQEIGLNGWSSYNPNPPAESMVTSGPFNISLYEPGSSIELSRNPLFFYDSEESPPTSSTPASIEIRYYIFGTVAGASVCLIVIVLVDWHLKKNRHQ